MIKPGHTIEFNKPNKDRRAGDPLVIGMKGIVRRVLPASATIYPEDGDRVEAVFRTGYGSSFGAWVQAREIKVIDHA